MPLLYDSQLRKGQADNFVVIVTTDCLQIIPTTSNQAQEKKKKNHRVQVKGNHCHSLMGMQPVHLYSEISYCNQI